MNRKTLCACFVACLGMSVTAARSEAGPQDDQPATIGVGLTLRDGSYLVSQVPIETVVTLRTQIGAVELPLKAVADIQFEDDKETAKACFGNGDRLTGVFTSGALELTTCFGEITVDAPLIQHIQLKDPPAFVRRPSEDGVTPTYLSDLSPLVARVFTGYGWYFGNKGRRGHGHHMIRVTEAPSPHGLGMVPPIRGSAQMVYALDRRFERFVGAVALDDSTPGTADRPVTFRVLGDGKELWRSKPIGKSGKSFSFEIAVAGVETIELFVDCPGANLGAHTVWLEPRLYTGVVEAPVGGPAKPVQPESMPPG